MVHLEAGTHHGQQACPCVPGCEILICKSAAVDTDTACAVSLQKISALDAELLDDAVKRGSFEALRIPAFPAMQATYEWLGLPVYFVGGPTYKFQLELPDHPSRGRLELSHLGVGSQYWGVGEVVLGGERRTGVTRVNCNINAVRVKTPTGTKIIGLLASPSQVAQQHSCPAEIFHVSGI